MTMTPNLATLTVQGPCWSADVDVVALDQPHRNLALRGLFLDTQPRTVAGSNQVFPPNTLLALVVPREVRIQPIATQNPIYRWTRSSAAPTLTTPTAMRTALGAGQAALLLLGVDPSLWPPKASGKLPTLTCLAGDIGLDALKPDKDGVSKLYAALALDQPAATDPKPQDRTGAARLVGAVSVHSSGVSLYGRITLPWEAATNKLTGVFQLTRELVDTGTTSTPASVPPTFRLTIELERLTSDETNALITAWGDLSRALNPRNSLHGPAFAQSPAPRWVTLEIVNPLAAPHMFWTTTTWSEQSPHLVLQFAPGELNLLFSDQRPYDRDAPPTSLARYVPNTIVVKRSGADLSITLGAPGETTTNILDYKADFNTTQADWSENVTLTQLDLAFDPLETPQLLRTNLAMAAPRWQRPTAQTATVQQPDVLDPAVLWGSMPLEDGWAQLPVPNLTEQIYLDALPDAPLSTAASHGLLQGAVVLGNSRDEVLRNRRDEQPWSVTLLDAGAIFGEWRLQQSSDSRFVLQHITLRCDQPDVIINGLIWFGTKQPTLADALPDLDNWVTGLQSVPLKSLHLMQQRFPPLVTVGLEQLVFGSADETIPRTAPTPVDAAGAAPNKITLPSLKLATADLHTWSLTYRVDAALLQMLASADIGLLPPDVFAKNTPLIWRRHATLPLIQALPLTQNQSPPNYPSASRQLAPFTLPTVQQAVNPTVLIDLPSSWRFGVAADHGAATWPKLLSSATPADGWRVLNDLPLVSLSLPGLLFDPSATTVANGLPGGLLPMQYRFDLPYTDQVNALAVIPKVPRNRAEVSPLPDERPPEPPQPLTRATFADHWRQLAERANLASADDVTAFTRVGDQVVMRHLAEPYIWPVRVEVTTDSYPGSLAIGNTSDVTLAPISDDAALAGLSGQFQPQPDNSLARLPGSPAIDGALQVTSGSMAASIDASGLVRDQRGLRRAASRLTGGLIATEVIRTAPDAKETTYDLTSTLDSCELRLSDGQTWHFWCRDIPVQADPNGFDRDNVHSTFAQDVNDPEALSSDYDVLRGYEWRMAGNQPDNAHPQLLPFYGLQFYPLTLDKLQVNNGEIGLVALTGRLQLALPDRSELTDLANPVRVVFRQTADGLRLDDVSALDEIVWPLALSNNELSNAPYLRWQSIALKDGNLTIQDPTLHFFLFNVAWSLPVQPLVFTADGGLATSPVVEVTTGDGALALAAANLELDLANGLHAASVDLLVRLGRRFLAPAQGPDRAAFTATVRFQLPIAQTEVQASWQSASLFDDLPIVTISPPTPDAETSGHPENVLHYAERSLQFTWQRVTSQPSDRFQLLPGMHLLLPNAPGFAAVTFEAQAVEDAQPLLTLASAFTEALLYGQWGAFLQDNGQLTSERVFGSSAGDLAFGYTARWQGGTWDESFLLNGFLEVKNLISWPLDLTYNEANQTLSLPATRGSQAPDLLRHTRHTLRVLLNQQPLAPDLLVSGAGQLLFQLATGRTWQFLAVVEHQMLDLLPVSEPTNDQQEIVARSAESRWTALQEVRLLPPASMRNFLQTYGADPANTFDPGSGINQLDSAVDGSLHTGLRERLIAALATVPDDMLLVEASAPHWVSKRNLSAARPTTLQFLPGGSQHGIMSGPQDYAPSDPHDPAWLLITTPFLGRLQDSARDHLSTASDVLPNALQVDPIQRVQQTLSLGKLPDRLTLALINRGDDAEARIRIAAMDTDAGRTWARLDPLTLEENWYRVNVPRAEPAPASIQSIIAALPDTPARLSRSVALRRAFDVFRPAYPPTDKKQYQLPDDVSGAEVLWRPRSVLIQQSVSEVRVTRGLVAYYTFTEGSGTTVADVSGVGSSLNLKIDKPNAVTWLPDGGLRVNAAVQISSTTDPSKIAAACVGTNALTIEAWLKPASPLQPSPSHPGRIVALSKDATARNVTLQQGTFDVPEASYYHVRVHTDKADDGHQIPLVTPTNSLTTNMQHIVYTRDASGRARLYIDGIEQANAAVAGKLDWNRKYALTLANEPTGDRPWFGDYYLVAIYSQALRPDEVQQNFAARSRPVDYGWHTTGLLLHAGWRNTSPDTATATVERHAATTLLPARLAVDVKQDGTTTSRSNPLPLSFAISPYVGLEFRRAPVASELQPLLLVGELLCLDRVSGAIRPAATRIWEIDKKDTQANAAAVRGYIQTWAAETQRQLAPESPIAVLRIREVLFKSVGSSPDEALLTTGYRFEHVTGQGEQPTLTRRHAHLRAQVEKLRFREGQYGGHLLPKDIKPFELAPPQTVGVQPLFLTDRPGTALDSPLAWPWGMSGLRLSVRYTAGATGVVGTASAFGGPKTLWWQAPQHRVQYRSAVHSDLPTAGLPQAFRAPAIKALLPVIPDPKMPPNPIDTSEASEDDRLTWWQPILPGALRYLLTGTRAGVTFAIRNQVLRQRLGGSNDEPVLVSGSVPVQHRTPRPVPLRENAPAEDDHRERALRTWASYFVPDKGLRAEGAPLDEAFFAGAQPSAVPGQGGTPRPARGLLLRLTVPQQGRIDSTWDGALVFDATPLDTQSTAADWNVQLAVLANSRTSNYHLVASNGNSLRFEPDPATSGGKPEDIRTTLLSRSAPGDLIVAKARVAPANATNGFRQMLVFPLRIGNDVTLPLPLEQTFIHFEDPEYNRQLASQVAKASQIIALSDVAGSPDANGRTLLRTITLAADRHEYNPDSVLSLRYDWDDTQTSVEGLLELRRIDINGIETVLIPPTADNSNVPGVLHPFSLLDLQRKQPSSTEKPPFLRPGDTLQIRLGLPEGQLVVLDVRIVADPVIPVPEAGYALLRQQTVNGQVQVECARFAWAPNASRIELVDAEDLRTEVVRRRAVFQWRDTVRPERGSSYAVQKITGIGSTHTVTTRELIQKPD